MGLVGVLDMPHAPALSLAERYRAHREAFELAQQLRCTPAEARQELDRRAAKARSEEAQRRLDAKRNGTANSPNSEPTEPPRWMMFD